MQLTAQQVFDSAMLVARIIRENRPLPLKGAYRLARMHAKLLIEFTPIAEKRDGLITAYDHKAKDLDGVEAQAFSVPPDKAEEFGEAWKEIAEQKIEVEVEPIPLEQLDAGGVGSITASELITLGELVRE